MQSIFEPHTTHRGRTSTMTALLLSAKSFAFCGLRDSRLLSSFRYLQVQGHESLDRAHAPPPIRGYSTASCQSSGSAARTCTQLPNAAPASMHLFPIGAVSTSADPVFWTVHLWLAVDMRMLAARHTHGQSPYLFLSPLGLSFYDARCASWSVQVASERASRLIV